MSTPLRRRLWQAGQKNRDDIAAAFAVLERAIERGDELKLSLDSCIDGPHFANGLLCLVAEDTRNLFPIDLSGAFRSPNNAASQQI